MDSSGRVDAGVLVEDGDLSKVMDNHYRMAQPFGAPCKLCEMVDAVSFMTDIY
ncbi:hypothetical protein DPMN_031175 [Dreissena polymorpha]|uniref:Uncharacterized protein n=1 Tax=Dreissena polymorpha TaxID=45954 RepID=A0A9D4M1Q4_DREPO|nr:hypothetical protein DPMN_031175 [Dreissena polymorpha]